MSEPRNVDEHARMQAIRAKLGPEPPLKETRFEYALGDGRVVIGWRFSGRYEARLYVNGGTTATMLRGKWKTKAGMDRWVRKITGKLP